MKRNKRALFAAGLMAGAALLGGCTAQMKPAATPTPQTPKVTAQPAGAEPTAQTSPAATDGMTMPEDGEETPAPIPLSADGKEIEAGALEENSVLMLPLVETGEALGWTADSEKTEEEGQARRVVSLEQEGSRITVSWTVSDNTAKGVTWQKDGLLIPVDARLTTMDDVVYVPSAFFEEAMDATVTQGESGVTIEKKAPADTPETAEQTPDTNA